MRRALVLLAAASAVATGIAAAGSSAAPRHVLVVPWSGTLDGNGIVAGAQTCSGTWQGKLALSVAGTTVTGSGSVDVGNPACSLKLPAPDLDHADFTVTGTKDSTNSGDTRFTLFMHGQSVSPSGSFYDPSGFLAHFGQTNEGIPLVLVTSGGRIDQKITNTVPIQNATITLNDHFVLKISCDQNLLDKAQREYQTATGFADAGIKEGDEAVDKGKDFLVDYGKEKAAEIVNEANLGDALTGLNETVGEAFEDYSIILKLGSLAIDIGFKALPAYREVRSLSSESKEDFDRADTWFDRANADLDKVKAEGTDDCVGALHDELDSLLKKESLDEQAQKLIEGWNAGGSTYLNPVNGEVLGEEAAIQQAKAILLGKARSPQTLARSSRKIKVTAKQLRAAVSDVRRALGLHAKAEAQFKRYRTSTTTLLGKLKKLLKR